MKRRVSSSWVIVLILGLLAGCGDGRSAFDAAAGTSSPPGTVTTSESPTTVPPQTTAAPSTGAPPTTVAPTSSAVPTTAAPATSAPPQTTTSIQPATTESTAPPNTSPGTVTGPPPPPCPGTSDGPIPPGATDVSVVTGDVNGDGFLDEFAAYQDGGMWYLRAELHDGFARTYVLDGEFEVKVLGGLPVGGVQVENLVALGSPSEYAFVRLGTGLVAYYGLFSFGFCQVIPVVESTSGRMPDLWVGGSPAHVDRPICGPDNQIHMTVFGVPEGCPDDVDTCDPVNIQQTTYLLTHPAEMSIGADGSDVVSAAIMDAVLARNCFDY